jgi:hypothetical protein
MRLNILLHIEIKGKDQNIHYLCFLDGTGSTPAASKKNT